MLSKSYFIFVLNVSQTVGEMWYQNKHKFDGIILKSAHQNQEKKKDYQYYFGGLRYKSIEMH